MKNTRKFLYFYLVIILFLVAPFTLSYTDVDKGELFHAKVLPSIVATICSIIRWIILGIMAVNSLFLLQKNLHHISKPVIFLFAFYVVQLVYATVDGFDIPRFFLMSSFVLLIPLHISIAFRHYGKKLLKYFTYCMYFFIVFSLILNGNLVFSGQRFFGFINNSNLYAMTAVFWSVILFLRLKNNKENKNIFLYIFLVVLILTIILSGSRNGLIGILIVLLFNFHNKLKIFLIGVVLLIAAFYFLSNITDLHFVTDRLFNIENAASDSGREDVWSRAYAAISQNLYTGNGMNANNIFANTGNMHNCYIRFILNMGLIFTLIALIQYVLSIFYVLINRNKVPVVILAFLIAYTVANFGEDYFVGLGSSMFIYIMILYGLINYYLKFHTVNK